MKTNKIKFSLIVFALFIGANLVAQITPANAYGKTSKMVANQDFDAEANATFKFDIEVRGTFKFGSKSDKFLYYLNSADGSMFFPENISPLAAQQTNDQHFDGMLIDPNGVVHQYWTDTDDDTKTVTTLNFFGSSPVNGNPNAFQTFLENADKSPGTPHSHFGSTTVYKGNSGGKQMKMTISNSGVAVAMNPDVIGLMAPIFKDHKQKINRIVTRFEYDNLIVSIDDVNQINIKKNAPKSFTMNGYEQEGAEINLDTVINTDASAYLNAGKGYLEKMNVFSQKMNSLQNELNACRDDTCRNNVKSKINDLKDQMEAEQEKYKDQLRNLGIQNVYGDED